LLEELKQNYEGIVVGPNVTLVLDYPVPMRLVSDSGSAEAGKFAGGYVSFW